ncbi:ubiquitin carboxyl-terminal hydrolase 20-like [Euphorbia lathyris]|uniref:ubiquitin carboxyl-terminal hydrolase 20-like n=1 Tax=Euphorbia lathyris TaxID=212925 RepID=UPI00331394E1
MAISNDAVVVYFPSPNSETLDGQSLVLPSSNPSGYSSLPSMDISIPTVTSGSDKTLDGHLHALVSGEFGFPSELSNLNGSSSVVSTSPDGKAFDPVPKEEESTMEGVFQLLDQTLDDTPIETRDYESVVSSDGSESSACPPVESPNDEPLVTLPVDPHPRETPIDNVDDFDDLKSANEIEPEENPSYLPVSWELPRTTVYRSCNCNRYSRLRRPDHPCGSECEFYQRVSNSWDSWYDRDDRPPSYSFPAETGVGAGLSNLGNTCFLNAILQCFTHTVPLVKALRSSDHLMPCQRGLEGFCVVCALRDHVECSLASSGKIISPSQVVDNLSQISSCFHRYQQEDAHEFLQCLLDKLESCFDSTLKDQNSSSQDVNIVQRVFGGRLVSKLRCCNCGHCSDKYEPLIDLSLEIEEAETLQNALESFTKVEKIEDTETKFRCDNCKVEVSMEKQLILDQAPSVATLHLKRFKTDGSFIEKMGKHVHFPLELDLEPYSNGSQGSSETQEHLKYQLYAVVVHNGYSPTSGHYFCYVRSSPSIWHKLDDSMVIRVEEEMVLSEAAYILFYVREDVPWFSSLMETQKDPNTSPKSVLDRVESECTAYPNLENIDLCKAGVNSGDVERIFTPLPCEPVVEDDRRNQTDEITARISCNNSKDDVPMIDASMSIAVEATNCHGDKFGALPFEGNNNGPAVHRIQRNDAIDHFMPPSSPPPEIYVKEQPESRHKICRNQLKLENAINDKKLKCNRDERTEALRYIRKNVNSSRGMKLLAAMVPRNDKKRRLQSSPCKQGSHPGSRSKLLRRQEVLR